MHTYTHTQTDRIKQASAIAASIYRNTPPAADIVRAAKTSGESPTATTTTATITTTLRYDNNYCYYYHCYYYYYYSMYMCVCVYVVSVMQRSEIRGQYQQGQQVFWRAN